MITRRGSRHRARGLLFSPAPGVMVVSDQFGRSAKRVPRVSARAQRERASDHRLRGDRHEVLIKGPAKTSSSHLHLLFRPLPEEARLPPPPLAATRKHATSEEARRKKVRSLAQACAPVHDSRLSPPFWLVSLVAPPACLCVALLRSAFGSGQLLSR